MLLAIARCLALSLLALPASAARAEPATPFFTPMPGGSRQACSGCHGMDGAGNREGARSMPAIQWSTLSRPTEKRPAYDPASFARAVTQGHDPFGRELSSLMPRYALPAETLDALVALLGRLGEPRAHGVLPDTLVFATILPEPRQAHHDRAAWLIQTLFDGVNAEGGIYGRQLKLVTFAGDADFAARREREPVLALLLSFGHDPKSSVDRAAEGIPDLFPILPIAAGEDDRRIKGFTAGEDDVAAALIRELTGPLGSRAVLILGGEGQPSVRRATEAALRTRQLEPVANVAALAGKPDAAVLLLGPDVAPPCDGQPLLVASSIDVLAGMDVAARAEACNWRLVFGDPRFQPDPAGETAVRLQKMVGDVDLLDTDRAAFVAAELAIRAATAAGRSVNRRSLVEAFAALGRVETGIWPALDFRQHPLRGTNEVRVSDTAGQIGAKDDAERAAPRPAAGKTAGAVP